MGTPRGQATLDRLVSKSGRRSGIQLPHTFARGDERTLSPLAQLVRGGRGGDVRLKLYLTLVLVAGSEHTHPRHGKHSVVGISGRRWAEALDLPDPEVRGARRIADAQNSLAELGLISLERRPGDSPFIRLLSPNGTGAAFTRPTAPYLTVPLELWSKGWIRVMGAVELAIFLALHDYFDGRPRQWIPKSDRDLYGLSADSWRIGAKSLEARGLLKTGEVTDGPELATPRRRKTFELLQNGIERDPSV